MRPFSLHSQSLTDEQKKWIQEHRKLLLEHIRINASIQRHNKQIEYAGAPEFIYAHYRLLKSDGFGDVEETPKMKQLTAHVWNLADRYEEMKIEWDEFRDEVERWYLLVSSKLETRRGPKAVARD
jgi:hypothetical protein